MSESLRIRARQQAVVAELGQQALTLGDLDPLMDAAARALADVLAVGFVEVLELEPGRERFAVRAMVGDELDEVPFADTQVGLSLDLRRPVVVDDTTAEDRFDAGTLRRAHGVVAGLAVPMLVGDRELGAIGVHAREPREFSQDDVHFVQAVGNVLAAAMDRHRREDALAESSARLARAERLETVGQLAGGIAHDFNNLLAVIANYAGFVRGAVPADSQAAEDVAQILAACERAGELTQRLLLFSRRRAGNPEVIDLAGVIAETERLLRRTLGEHVALRTAVQPGLWRVEADRGQLEQVLLNLAINARDAMPHGGELLIEARNAVLDGADVVRIAVTDTGSGMGPEIVDRAFEPFFTTKSQAEGTGLGLATVYGIVRGAGGHVELRSEPGSGTTVVAQLPATDVEPGERLAGDGDAPAPGTGESVLVVEDSEPVRVLTSRILRDAGYDVRAEGDPRAALAGDAAGDVLVTDVVMPGLGGRELADELRRRRPGLPVVFVSGYAEDYVIESAREDGATAFVEKPFAADDLLAAVRRVLDG